MDLVNKKYGPSVLHTECSARGINDGADILDSGGDSGQFNESGTRRSRHQVCQRRLPCAGWAPQDERDCRLCVSLEQASQGAASPDEVALPDEIIHGARPHTHREGCPGAFGPGSLVKKRRSHVSADYA